MPKDSNKQRMQSRRAASKEALKQMHILLDDEKKYEISSDDDDVIEVDVQPPKKKYKLSHRKSSDGNDRDVIVLKSVDEPPLDLEVVIEDLQPCQKTRRENLIKEKEEVDAKMQQLLAAPNMELIYNGIYTTAVEITERIQSILNNTTAGPSVQSQSNSLPSPATPVSQPVVSQSIVLQQQSGATTNSMPQSYQLVMDPRLGVIVGAVSAAPNTTPNTPPLQLYQPKVTTPSTQTATAEQTTMKTRRGTLLRQMPNSVSSLQKTPIQVQKATPQKTNKVQLKTPVKAVQQKTSTITPKPITSLKPRTPANNAAAPIAPFRPTESNVEGGLSMGKPSKSIDLTGEDGRALPDSREVSFNKLQGRTYPSLVVVARPHLRVKDLASDRGKLDIKVKSVLMYPPTKFTEWLIQQGLVRSEQKCSIHPANPLKLGMYSDASKFPYSGGYVWISECCPQRFVSVFSGSIFEGSQHPPMAILKLLYHWCCQTIVQNVTQWVKVDNLYVKGMYTWLRSVCTVALHTHIKQLGGPGVKVQVGVISLGTTSQDGNKREVKVEVLGILETTTRHIRLRAVEPLVDGERNYKKRFSKILEPVHNWVHPASTIVTDLTVDKSTLHQMGFVNVVQSTSTDYAQSNRTIMEYLRRIVPRMFQNTLSLLSRQIIQQFLDELVWREWYGTTVLNCFDNMLQHLSEQTRHESGGSLITRLNKVSANPFKNWAVPAGTANASNPPPLAPKTEQPTPKRYSRQRKPATPQPPPPPPPVVVQDVVRPAKSTSPDVPEQMVPLENYYYGTITPEQSSRTKMSINIKCPFCKLNFNTNIALMNHLFKHAHNVSNDVQLCKYCLTIVPTANDLLKHIGTSHPDETKFDNGFVCLICESHFRNPFILGKHMSKEHCPSELPYMCGTCSFRCSNHKQAVDHFYQQHDQGTTIQCPFCLKSTTIFSGGRNISQNMNYFIQHLQKHQKKHLAKRCGRCTLWFIQKEFLKDHQTKMHISQRGKPGLVPCFAPRNGVMVPKSRMDKCPDDAKVINFSTLYFNVGKNLSCKECNKSLSTPKHFASFENCQNPNCQFSTCCTTAMQEHVAKCKVLNSKLPMEKLPYEMHCVCGYSDVYGNQMAKHLAICERKSAYPSKQAAKDATVTHSMLDVLGLVRKPEEATSTSKEEPKRTEPIILKHRGRPRKNPDASKQQVKEVVEVKDDDVKNGSEVQISISDVRGGVKEEKVEEHQKKVETEDKNVKEDVDKQKSEDEAEKEKEKLADEEEKEDSKVSTEDEEKQDSGVVIEGEEKRDSEDVTEEAPKDTEVVEEQSNENYEDKKESENVEEKQDSEDVEETQDTEEVEKKPDNEDDALEKQDSEVEEKQDKEEVAEELEEKQDNEHDTDAKQDKEDDAKEIEEQQDDERDTEETEEKQNEDSREEVEEKQDNDDGAREELEEKQDSEEVEGKQEEVEDKEKQNAVDQEGDKQNNDEDSTEKETVTDEDSTQDTEISENAKETEEIESMDVDSCKNTDAVAIEENDICPMDTD